MYSKNVDTANFLKSDFISFRYTKAMDKWSVLVEGINAGQMELQPVIPVPQNIIPSKSSSLILFQLLSRASYFLFFPFPEAQVDIYLLKLHVNQFAQWLSNCLDIPQTKYIYLQGHIYLQSFVLEYQGVCSVVVWFKVKKSNMSWVLIWGWTHDFITGK